MIVFCGCKVKHAKSKTEKLAYINPCHSAISCNAEKKFSKTAMPSYTDGRKTT